MSLQAAKGPHETVSMARGPSEDTAMLPAQLKDTPSWSCSRPEGLTATKLSASAHDLVSGAISFVQTSTAACLVFQMVETSRTCLHACI